MHPHFSTRRTFLQNLACGVGGIGLSTLLADADLLAADKAAVPRPHHAPKAKSLIFLNMQGGPSQFETFDHKPALEKYAGKDIPPGPMGSVRFPGKILPSVFPFSKQGQSGLAVCDVFPHMGKVADDLCVIKSMVCDSQDHPSGQRQALTGYARQPMPSLGSWIVYGLGAASKNLPSFVYLGNGTHHGAGFLPSETQGMPVGKKMPNLVRAAGVTEAQQRDLLDSVARLNQRHAAERPGANDLTARIEAAELAFRMQMSCPEAVDLTRESKATLDLYGVSDTRPPGRIARTLTETKAEFASMCLIARRLVERGVRVITLCVGGRRGWDQHGNLKASIAHNAAITDQPMAALLTDLRAKGLLDRTLVMWGGEFGRTSYAQNTDGRDHFHKGFTYWLAGGGVKAGTSYGATDELGLDVAENRVHIHDLHATVLWQLGLDPERLTYRYSGRDQRLTDVDGKVVRGLLA